MSRQRRYQLKHKSVGLCVLCPAPLLTAHLCAKHAQFLTTKEEESRNLELTADRFLLEAGFDPKTGLKAAEAPLE